MIKKNLFLLFCFYLFVIQIWICGLFWHDNKFFILAAINFVIMALILLCTKNSDWNAVQTKNTEKIGDTHHKEFEVRETTHTPVSAHRINQWKKKVVSNIWFFIISVLAWLFARFRIWNIATHLKILVCVAWAFLVYIILWSIFGSKIFRSKLSVLFIFCLIMAWIRSIVNMFNLLWNIWKLDTDTNTWSASNQTWTSFVDEKEVINTWIIDNSVDTWMILSWTNSGDVVTWEIADENTWMDIKDENTNDDNVNEDNTAKIKYSWWDNSLATFTDVLKFLLKDTTLRTDTKVAFQNISKTNADYPYFRTAYEKKMIWTDIQPNQKPSCETFVVMKWLVEWWSVWTYSNIKQAYWQYAKENWKLPNCKYWSNIKIWEMK